MARRLLHNEILAERDFLPRRCCLCCNCARGDKTNGFLALSLGAYLSTSARARARVCLVFLRLMRFVPPPFSRKEDSKYSNESADAQMFVSRTSFSLSHS